MLGFRRLSRQQQQFAFSVRGKFSKGHLVLEECPSCADSKICSLYPSMELLYKTPMVTSAYYVHSNMFQDHSTRCEYLLICGGGGGDGWL